MSATDADALCKKDEPDLTSELDSEISNENKSPTSDGDIGQKMEECNKDNSSESIALPDDNIALQSSDVSLSDNINKAQKSPGVLQTEATGSVDSILKLDTAIVESKRYESGINSETNDKTVDSHTEQAEIPQATFLEAEEEDNCQNNDKNTIEMDDNDEDDDEDLKLRFDEDDEVLSDYFDDEKNTYIELNKVETPSLGDKHTIVQMGAIDEMVKDIQDQVFKNDQSNESENIKSSVIDNLFDTKIQCRDDSIDMDTEYNLLKEDIVDDKCIKSAILNQMQTDDIQETINTEIEGHQLTKENKQLAVKQVANLDKIDLDASISKDKIECILGDDPDNVENSDISVEMEDKLLKDDDQVLDKVIHQKNQAENENETVLGIQPDSINKNMDTVPIKIEDSERDREIVKTEIRSPESSISKISKQSSSLLVKTSHALSKPDAMLEIPTQGFIDIDDPDASLNLGESIDNGTDTEFASSTITEEKTLEDENSVKEEITAPEILTNDIDKIYTLVSDKTVDLEKKIDSTKNNTEVKETENVVVEKATSSVKTLPEDVLCPTNTAEDVQPSTSFAVPTSSNMTPDTSDEVPEMTDSLGLLAESSGRVMDDDEEVEDDDEVENDEADNEDDFDPEDESSNPMTTAEQSEDSDPHNSETEVPKDQEETSLIDIQSPALESPALDNETGEFRFRIGHIESEIQADIERKGMEIDETESVEDTSEITLTEEIQLLDEDSQVDVTATSPEDKLSKTETKDEEMLVDQTDVETQTDIETVKLSDTSDNEAEVEAAVESIVAIDEDPDILSSKDPEEAKASPKSVSTDESKQSPNKKKKLEVSQGSGQPVFNIVDLGDSDDEVKEVKKRAKEAAAADDSDVTSVNIPKGIDVMVTSAGSTSDLITKEGEVVISGVPKPPPLKHTAFRLNTSELSIKTTTVATESTLVIPETTIGQDPSKAVSVPPKMGLEIFSLDSDEEDMPSSILPPKERTPLAKLKTPEPDKSPPHKCINTSCTSGSDVPQIVADATVAAFYGAPKKRKPSVCRPCADAVSTSAQDLINGIKDFAPLLELCASKMSQELVEISDSDEEEEVEPETPPPAEPIGDKAAKLIEESLASLINETWIKYKMDSRISETEGILNAELDKLDKESKEIDQMLNECQVATDRLRKEFYATFEQERRELPPYTVFDTPSYSYAGPVTDDDMGKETRQSKRRLSSASDLPAKKPAIPLGYTPLDGDTSQTKAQELKQSTPAVDSSKMLLADDDKDVSVVKLSAEAAPAWLPPAGELTRAPLRVAMSVYAMRNAFGPWLRAKVLECQPRTNQQFTTCRVKFDHKVKNACKIIAARGLAYPEPPDVRMTIGTRIIALFKDETTDKRESFYSGVVAEIPNPVNNYRYLVFFDDGYAQYVEHSHTRLVCESAHLVWEEVHPFSREFVREYLLAYPERPMVRLHEGQCLRTEWNGKWWNCKVLRVDASLAQILFTEDGRKEWIYRGSTRLAPLFLELKAAERHRQRPMPRSKVQTRSNMPYVEYTRSEEQANKQQQEAQAQHQQNEDIRRQRSVAKKSTTPAAAPAPAPVPAPVPAPAGPNLDTVTSRVVYYTPKNAVKPYKMVPHVCGLKCKRTDVLSLKELRTYNPLAKPLLSGWERQIVRFKGHKEVVYRAPCGRRVRGMRELHRYLRLTGSDLPVDLFDFQPTTHCLAEFVLNKCLVGKKDLSHGKENVPVPCVNYYDESLPEFCSYNTERTPTAGVPLNLDPEFLCGCDCTDDCQDKTNCACWKMTLEGARTIGLEGDDIGYEYKRLPEPLPSGIYECNSRCKCKDTCLNRVAQHPLQLKLQVFKTLNRGWGIRALNDVPKGAFLCVYAGNLLTDATANLDGLNEGDEYLAELDYIEVVEQMKEGYEEDIPEVDKRLDKKELSKQKQTVVDDEDDDELPSSEEEVGASKNEREDDDFQPGFLGHRVMEFNKRLRKRGKRDKAGKDDEDKKEKEVVKEGDDCITISDDEEIREPSRFTVQTGMGGSDFVSKYKSVRALFGKDEACYIMDAKVQGNIGRYLNHSCTPNVFVQNVFVDTHDPRFPWVAFFALSHIKAGTELTWNYNYDVGSVPGKVLYCYCGAPNCRGRLL